MCGGQFLKGKDGYPSGTEFDSAKALKETRLGDLLNNWKNTKGKLDSIGCPSFS